MAIHARISISYPEAIKAQHYCLRKLKEGQLPLLPSHGSTTQVLTLHESTIWNLFKSKVMAMLFKQRKIKGIIEKKVELVK